MVSRLFCLAYSQRGRNECRETSSIEQFEQKTSKKISHFDSVVDSKRRPLYLIVRNCRNCLANPRRYLMYEEVSLIFMFY